MTADTSRRPGGGGSPPGQGEDASLLPTAFSVGSSSSSLGPKTRTDSFTPSPRRWGSGPWGGGGKFWLRLILLVACASLTTCTFITVAITMGFGVAESKSVGIKSWWTEEPKPPCFAYIVTGSKGDAVRMKRLLQAIYHPRNEYILHLDLEAPFRERVELSRFVRLQPTFAQVGNVHMVAKSNLVTYKGPTMLSTYLHCMAILLRKRKDWDWFINLSASDYPLVTQDDLIHTFSFLPRDLNFVQHNSELGWKEAQRARPIVVDPGLYSSTKTDLFWATQDRQVPTSFKLFEGSAWVILTRSFSEYCIWGWDNLPRLALMYYTNFVSSCEGYFQTVVCNSREYRNTTVNSDMHYIQWDNPPLQHPKLLTPAMYPDIVNASVPFARKFPASSSLLDKIDAELLGRKPGRFVAGGWCVGSSKGGKDPCAKLGDPSIIRPTENARRLERKVADLLAPKKFRHRQCE